MPVNYRKEVRVLIAESEGERCITPSNNISLYLSIEVYLHPIKKNIYTLTYYLKYLMPDLLCPCITLALGPSSDAWLPSVSSQV